MIGNRNKCLFCREVLDDEREFHPHCSRTFFGTSIPPTLDYSLDEMDKLASQVIRTQVALPGVQAKISLDLEKSHGPGKTGRLTLVGLWGRFILKPPTQQYPALPEVEDATMHLAEAVGIRCVPHAMIRLKSGELAYITRRIDRGGKAKIPMEDLCQLTGRLTEDKYKGSLEQVGKTIRQYSTQPGLDAVNFFDLTLFCFLTGNADMHLKNFSLWRPSEEEIVLSPAYDLIATKLLLPQDSEETALALNGKKKNLRKKDFDALAARLELPEKTRENAYLQAAKAMGKLPEALKKSFLSNATKKDYLELFESRYAILELK